MGPGLERRLKELKITSPEPTFQQKPGVVVSMCKPSVGEAEIQEESWGSLAVNLVWLPSEPQSL